MILSDTGKNKALKILLIRDKPALNHTAVFMKKEKRPAFFFEKCFFANMIIAL